MPLAWALGADHAETARKAAVAQHGAVQDRRDGGLLRVTGGPANVERSYMSHSSVYGYAGLLLLFGAGYSLLVDMLRAQSRKECDA
jgi:hypothetical protein